MCGIAGFISRKRKPFDYSGFCSLGIANDTRGGDSCGVYIDGLNQYGVNEEKLFSVFFQRNKSIRRIREACIALLHCRKASVGVISKETAQPVVIKGKNGKTQFVLMHNGTLHNYEELAKKYIPDVDIKGMTDSQVMARIFYNRGYACLNEYNGAAVFVIVDYRNVIPHVLLWKGASKKMTSSKDIEEERPLWYCYDHGQLIFSSIGVNLVALRKNATVRPLPPNILWEFKNDRLMVAAKYDRANMQQNKMFINNYNNAYNSNYNNRVNPYSSEYDAYDDYDDYGYYARKKINNGGTYFSGCKTVAHSEFDNLYTINGELIYGRVTVSKYGTVLDNDSKASDTRQIWFFAGVPLWNARCMCFLKWLQSASKLSKREFAEKFENVINFFGVSNVYLGDNGKFMKATTPLDSVLFTGSIFPIITSRYMDINEGVKTMSAYVGYGIDNYEKCFQNEPSFNFKAIKKQCMTLLKEDK